MGLLRNVLIGILAVVAAGIGVAVVAGLMYLGAILGVVLTILACVGLGAFLIYMWIVEGIEMKKQGKP